MLVRFGQVRGERRSHINRKIVLRSFDRNKYRKQKVFMQKKKEKGKYV